MVSSGVCPGRSKKTGSPLRFSPPMSELSYNLVIWVAQIASNRESRKCVGRPFNGWSGQIRNFVGLGYRRMMSDKPFTPVRSPRLSEEIIRQIARLVRSGELKLNERFPSERALQD